MIVPDNNLLVYTSNADSPFPLNAKHWWKSILNGNEPFGLLYRGLTVWTFAIMMNRMVCLAPMEPKFVLAHISSWMDIPHVQFFHPGPRHLDNWNTFAKERALSRELASDAYLAAIALRVSCSKQQ